MEYRLPADLYTALLLDLPLRWHLEVQCACSRRGFWTLWWITGRRGVSSQLGTFIARTRCRECRAPPASAWLREVLIHGEPGQDREPRLVEVVIPPPTPKPPVVEVEQIYVDWSSPPPPSRPRLGR